MVVDPMPPMECQVGALLNASPFPFVKIRVPLGASKPHTKELMKPKIDFQAAVFMGSNPAAGLNPKLPHLVVDLNCGWYCARSLLFYWFQKINKGREPVSLPLDKGNSLLGVVRVAYNPGERISELTTRRNDKVPTNATAWGELLDKYGPVIVSGKLGGADWGPFGGVGHYVLVVGADTNYMYFKDPLKGDFLKTNNFAHFLGRIDKNDGINFLKHQPARDVLKRINAK